MGKIELWRRFLGLPKSIYFNFRYLPFLIAIRLPILLSHKVILSDLRGGVSVPFNARTGLIRIGFADFEIFDKEASKAVWHVSGKVVFQGKAIIGQGTKISCKEGGELVFCDGVYIVGETTIICRKKIQIGSKSGISWDVLIMDSDLHEIQNMSKEAFCMSKPVVIGDHVWVGCRAMILKGVVVDAYNIIGAGSVVTKSLPGQYQVYAGNPARLVKSGVTWVTP